MFPITVRSGGFCSDFFVGWLCWSKTSACASSPTPPKPLPQRPEARPPSNTQHTHTPQRRAHPPTTLTRTHTTPSHPCPMSRVPAPASEARAADEEIATRLGGGCGGREDSDVTAVNASFVLLRELGVRCAYMTYLVGGAAGWLACQQWALGMS